MTFALGLALWIIVALELALLLGALIHMFGGDE